jgi:TPP-dependent trihydroxycyclohexane-1,2-dione (THcHDO) dehydratase
MRRLTMAQAVVASEKSVLSRMERSTVFEACFGIFGHGNGGHGTGLSRTALCYYPGTNRPWCIYGRGVRQGKQPLENACVHHSIGQAHEHGYRRAWDD